MVEIKPKYLWNSDIVKRKKEAAEIWCKENNLTYKLIDIEKKINVNDLKILIKEDNVELTNRYKEKLNKYE